MYVRHLRASVPVIMFAVLSSGRADATFHLMQIEQVIGGVDNDTGAQAIQLRMRFPGQNLLAPSRLIAWDATGSNPVVLVDFASSVADGSAGARVLIASAGFAGHTSPAITPDFTMTNLIPEAYLPAGSLTFESDIGAIVYWRLSWGGTAYTGPTTGSLANEDDGDFGPPWPGPLPSTDLQALLFQGLASAVSTQNDIDYALTGTPAVFTNNAGGGSPTVECTDPAQCDDGVPCTDDDCAPDNTCSNVPNDTLCSDNSVFCDGAEFCHPLSGCISSGSPCGYGEFCSETGGVCDPAIEIALQPVVSGLVSPISLTHAGDGSGRLFIVDQAGYIRIVENGVLLPTPFLDLTSKIVEVSAFFDERGVLGVAFHPDYAVNGRFFVRYSAPRAGDPAEPCNDPEGFIVGCHKAVLAEYAVSADPNVADPGSEIILLELDEPQFNHNAGALAFGPDGFLYVALGDGGGAHDGLADVPPSHGPDGHGQNINTLLGAVLRLDVDSPPDVGMNYAIPADNPFVGAPGADEIYAYGFRNPYRFSFDDGPGGDGSLYVADVGQNLYEEVDIVSKGGNYGWVTREGRHCFDPFRPDASPVSCTATGPLGEALLDPVYEYDHNVGLAIVGGFVYRGTQVPALVGEYVHGDFSRDFGPTGRLFYSDTTGPDSFTRGEFTIVPAGAPLGRFLKGFGEDEAGEIYVLATGNLGPTGFSGVVYRIAETLTAPNPALVASAPHDVRKNRYISLNPNNAASPVALRVELTSMKRCTGDLSRTCRTDDDCPDVCDNDVLVQCVDDEACGGGTCVPSSPCVEHPDVGSVLGWIGQPFQVPEGCNPLPCGDGDWIARVEADPVYRLWTETTLHVGDCQIVPVATYAIRATVDEVTFSGALEVGTILKPDVRHYGDAVGAVSPMTGEYTPADGFVNVNDVQA
ncbi:MAG: PQQ-dependent sugar dehydrogenase, partial [Phycisphaerae bacterium]